MKRQRRTFVSLKLPACGSLCKDGFKPLTEEDNDKYAKRLSDFLNLSLPASISTRGIVKSLVDYNVGQAREAVSKALNLQSSVSNFAKAFDALANQSVENARRHGWDNISNFGETTALMHSELSEALEADRKGNPPDKHIPEFSSIEGEWADVIIRIMGAAKVRNLRVAEAVVAKIEANKKRPAKHGKIY